MRRRTWPWRRSVALIAILIIFGINWQSQRDFAREWAESLRVKGDQPLGEDALARRLAG